MLPWVAQSAETVGASGNLHWILPQTEYPNQCAFDPFNTDAGSGIEAGTCSNNPPQSIPATPADLGDAESAVGLLEPLGTANSRNPDFEYILGMAMVKSGHRRDGVRRIEKAAEAGDSGDAYMLAGATLLDLNEFEQARHDLEIAVQLAPKLRGLHTLVGMARDKTGDEKEAEPAFRQAAPDDFEANLYLGALLYKHRHLDEAKLYLDHAVKLKPSDTMARYESAMLKSTAGEYEVAAKQLEDVIKDNPDWLEPHVELTSLYYKLHRPEDGVKERAIVERSTAEQQAKGPGK